jgi:enoyl-CoA hydratase/carnithine racemase
MVPTLLSAREGATLVLTLSNPGMRNALGHEVYGPLRQAFEQAGTDSTLRAIVLTGADGVFSAGGNLRRMRDNREKPAAVQEASLDKVNAVIQALVSCSKPVIAAVEGAAAGAGLSLAMACDLVVAGEGAKFAMAHVRVGLSPDAGGTWFAARHLPRQAAAELLLEGEAWSAARMQQLGLVNRVVPDGSALVSALEHAQRIAALSPHAVGRIKALLAAAAVQPLAAQLESEKDSFIACLYHADGGEAIASFLEKRPARFS